MNRHFHFDFLLFQNFPVSSARDDEGPVRKLRGAEDDRHGRAKPTKDSHA